MKTGADAFLENLGLAPTVGVACRLFSAVAAVAGADVTVSKFNSGLSAAFVVNPAGAAA